MKFLRVVCVFREEIACRKVKSLNFSQNLIYSISEFINKQYQKRCLRFHQEKLKKRIEFGVGA